MGRLGAEAALDSTPTGRTAFGESRDGKTAARTRLKRPVSFGSHAELAAPDYHIRPGPSYPNMPLKVGVVGYGDAGRLHVHHLGRTGAEVAGIVTRKEPPPGIRRYDSLDALLVDVDAVTIAVPNHLHASLARKAVLAEKAVLVEKPLAMEKSELDEIEEALAAHPVPFQVGFRLRFSPELQALRERVARPRRIACFYRLGIEPLARGKAWTRRRALSGGAFFTLAVHALDLARWLSGARGEPLGGLRATSGFRDKSADFPLEASLSGMLPEGVEIVAGSDLRGDAPFRLDLTIDAERGQYPDPTLPGPRPTDEDAAGAEYGAMMAAFVERAEAGASSPDEVKELIQSHRDLLDARALAEET